LSEELLEPHSDSLPVPSMLRVVVCVYELLDVPLPLLRKFSSVQGGGPHTSPQYLPDSPSTFAEGSTLDDLAAQITEEPGSDCWAVFADVTQTNPALRAGLCKRLAHRAECVEQNRDKL